MIAKIEVDVNDCLKIDDYVIGKTTDYDAVYKVVDTTDYTFNNWTDGTTHTYVMGRKTNEVVDSTKYPTGTVFCYYGL